MENSHDTFADDHLITTFPLNYVPGAAIFDCDGTLAHTMPLHYQAWRGALEPLGVEFPEDIFYAWGGVTTAEIVSRLGERSGKTLDVAAVAHEKERLYHKLIPTITPLTPIIAEARRFRGLCPIAVASGGIGSMVMGTLATLDITDLFDTIVTADDVKNGKPAPDTFLLAAERLGIAPENCVVYEDSPTGFEAARRAGMKAIDVRPYLEHLMGRGI